MAPGSPRSERPRSDEAAGRHAPRTVAFLRALGHDVIRVNEVLPPTAPDAAIVAEAVRTARSILTQDLDFSAIVALSGRSLPSVISLRLSSSRVERVNAGLQEVLPTLEDAVGAGVIATVQDTRVRVRQLPL